MDFCFPKPCTPLDSSTSLTKSFRTHEWRWKKTYCVGSGSRWSLVDTCRCSLWRCPLWKIHWSHMPLCCGRGLDGRDLQGKGGDQKVRSLNFNRLRPFSLQSTTQMSGQCRWGTKTIIGEYWAQVKNKILTVALTMSQFNNTLRGLLCAAFVALCWVLFQLNRMKQQACMLA